MKRIAIWIDSEDENIERVCRRLEKFLNSQRLSYRILDVCELKLPGNDK